MITFFDLIQKNEFRDFVEKRLASSTEKTYTFPKTFPKLYRYRSLSKYLIDDIVNGQLTLSSIDEFNDIFDGAIHQFGSKEEIEKAAEADWAEYEELLKGYPSADRVIKRDNIIENSKKYYKTESRLSFRKLDYLGTYVCCFSENNASTLMWSHYADSNKGICIEYDFNKLQKSDLIRSSVFPVAYTKSPINTGDLLGENGGKVFQYPLDAAVLCTALNKADIWSYEQEWRLVWVLSFLEKEMQRLPIKLTINPSKVYLGYHFLKQFFYYKDKDKEKDTKNKKDINSMINKFMELTSFLQSNQIPVAIMMPSIGSFDFIPYYISIDILKSFMQQHFVNRPSTSIRFYYSLHDQLLDLLEKSHTPDD